LVRSGQGVVRTEGVRKKLLECQRGGVLALVEQQVATTKFEEHLTTATTRGNRRVVSGYDGERDESTTANPTQVTDE